MYTISGFFHVPVQIVVTRELPKEEPSYLHLLTHHAERKGGSELVREVMECKDPEDRRNLEALLRVSVKANPEMYQSIKEEDEMSDRALRILFGEEMDQAEAKGIEYGIRAMVLLLRKRSASREETASELENLYNLSAEEAAAKVDLYWQIETP